MRWLKPAAALAFALAAATSAYAQSDEAKHALADFKSLRPTDDDLVMYRLDWAASFKAGQERAAKEKKPLFVIVIHARYGECFTGHC